jgi:hypothetical protein
MSPKDRKSSKPSQRELQMLYKRFLYASKIRETSAFNKYTRNQNISSVFLYGRNSECGMSILNSVFPEMGSNQKMQGVCVQCE